MTLQGITPEHEPATIGFKPGSEAVTDDIESLVDSFNSILQIAEKHSGSKQSNEKLLKDINKLGTAFYNMGLKAKRIGKYRKDFFRSVSAIGFNGLKGRTYICRPG